MLHGEIPAAPAAGCVGLFFALPLAPPVRRLETSIPTDSRLLVALLRQIFVEERRQLAEVLLRLGRIGIARILRMRLAFEHVEIRDDAGLT
jgi:hypothetical protein